MDQSSRTAFFDLMTNVTDVLSRETSVLGELVEFISDSDVIAKRVSTLEADADFISHQIANMYREQNFYNDEEAAKLYKIINMLEECTDVIDTLATSFVSYNITEVRNEMVQDIVSIDSCAMYVGSLIDALKEQKDFTDCQKIIIAVNHFKDNAVKSCADNMRDLFIYEKDPIEIIKWKEIITQIVKVFECFEETADICEEYLLNVI